MGFWIYMLITCELLPILVFVIGICFSKRAPKSINYIFGYRTARSMKSPEAWEFAHKYIGKIWSVLGAIMVPLSAIILFVFIGRDEETVGNVGLVILLLQTVSLIIPIFPTEMALKNKFN